MIFVCKKATVSSYQALCAFSNILSIAAFYKTRIGVGSQLTLEGQDIFICMKN